MRQIFLFFLSVALLGLLGCSKQKSDPKTTPPKAPPPSVKVHTLQKADYPIWIRFSGKTQAFKDVDLLSRVTGELLASTFKEGSFVQKGTLLFRIDKREYRAQWDRANANLQRDAAAYALAQAEYNRYAPLVKEQLATREKLDQIIAKLRQLKETLKADKAALETVEINLDYCDVKAPISGYVGKAFVLPGNLVKPGTLLSRLVNATKLYVHFAPSTREVALIKRFSKSPFPPVRVFIEGDSAQTAVLHGNVDFIDNFSSSSTGTVAMRALVDNPKGMIVPGSFVTVELFLGKYHTLAVHPDQVNLDQEGEYVLAVDKNNTLHKLHFHPLFSNADLVIPDKELTPGTRVVTQVLPGLGEGTVITPVEVPDPIRSKRE